MDSRDKFKRMLKPHRHRKYSLLIPNNNAVPFQEPPKTKLNEGFDYELAWKIPPAAPENRIILQESGRVKNYYIPRDTYQDLQKIFNKFSIPDELRPDMIWGYINMYFASCKLPVEEYLFNEHEKGQRELYDLINFINDLTSNNNNLEKCSLQSKSSRLILSSPSSLALVKILLVNFKELSKNTGKSECSSDMKFTFRAINRNYINYTDDIQGEKNNKWTRHREVRQKYYAEAILKYLSGSLPQPSKHSKNLQLRFIGEMMKLSGLAEGSLSDAFLKNRLRSSFKSSLKRNLGVHPNF